MVWIYTLNETITTTGGMKAVNGKFKIANKEYNEIRAMSGYFYSAVNTNTNEEIDIADSSGNTNQQYREIILCDERSLKGDIAWLEQNSVKSTPKTWVFYPNPSLGQVNFTSSDTNEYTFTSNGKTFQGLGLFDVLSSITNENHPVIKYYQPSSSPAWVEAYDTNENRKSVWTDNAYRTITFEQEPTGELLQWLQKVAFIPGERLVSRVVLDSGKILIDISSDTVTPETLAEGIIAHDKDGNEIVGTLKVT